MTKNDYFACAHAEKGLLKAEHALHNLLMLIAVLINSNKILNLESTCKPVKVSIDFAKEWSLEENSKKLDLNALE